MQWGVSNEMACMSLQLIPTAMVFKPVFSINKLVHNFYGSKAIHSKVYIFEKQMREETNFMY